MSFFEVSLLGFFIMNFSTSQGMATQGYRQFTTGIASGNPKSLVFNKYAADVMREVAVDLFKEQAETAVYLNQRTGDLVKHLKSAPFTIAQSNGVVALELKYILKIRAQVRQRMSICIPVLHSFFHLKGSTFQFA